MAALVDASGNRHKGRLPSQMRPLVLERSVLEACDGSAKWVQDGTAVLAAVSGPLQAGARREDAERLLIQVVFKPRHGLPGSRERAYEVLLQALLERVVLTAHHPRTLITVVVQVLQDDGSVLAVALNAVAAALADAGVPMSSMFAGVCVGFGADGTLVMDPDEAEEQSAAAVLTAAYPSTNTLKHDSSSSSSNRELVVPDESLLLVSRGHLTLPQLAQGLTAAHQGCGGVGRFVHLALTNSFRDTLVKSGDPAVAV